MPLPASEVIRFKRNHFATRLPKSCLYTRSHFWLLESENGAWRVGMTQFATRMLGEIVEFDFEVAVGAGINVGQVIGWIEGFKAVSDIYGVVSGDFQGPNPGVMAQVDLVCADPYDRGWLYGVSGVPDPDVLDVDGYVSHLESTIDRMLEKPWQSEETTGS